MKVYLKVLEVLFKILIGFVSIALAVMILVTFLEVIRRYFFGKSFEWAEELVRYLIVAVGFIGGAAAFKSKGLVSLDILTSHFPMKVRNIIELVSNTVILGFLIFLLKASFETVISPAVMLQYSIGLPISMAIPYAVMPVGFVIMIIFAIDNYRELFFRLREGENSK